MPLSVRLGSRPKHFTATVQFQLHEGGMGQIQMQYVYRTRREFGEFVDRLVTAAGTPPPANQSDEAVRFSLAQALQATGQANAEYILQIASGWDLDEPFSLPNVLQLCDELPGAAAAIMERYRSALTEGRLGN